MKKFIPILHYGLSFFIIGVVLLLLMDQVVMPMYVKHGQQITLPDVRKMEFEEAEQLLQSKGFEPVKSDMKYNADFEPNEIIDQQPAANSTVKSGRRVYLTVATEQAFIEMPNMKGNTYRGAMIQLSRIGLRLDTNQTQRVYSDEFPEGVVVWQSVKENALIRRGSEVQLRISMGQNPNQITVPNLINLSLEDARSILSDSRLSLGNVRYEVNEDLIPYTILEQSIDAGNTVRASQEINVIVSVLNESQGQGLN
ncbi:MAG: PASTA domain-containing protein [Candidatus Marinimicrobia bacterium]|nr:PASTA domain-containing protein [Candidatus Neomarinimicrobiota bacterium]